LIITYLFCYNTFVNLIFTDDPTEVWCNDAINNPGMYTKVYTGLSTRSKYFSVNSLFSLLADNTQPCAVSLTHCSSMTAHYGCDMD